MDRLQIFQKPDDFEAIIAESLAQVRGHFAAFARIRRGLDRLVKDFQFLIEGTGQPQESETRILLGALNDVMLEIAAHPDQEWATYGLAVVDHIVNNSDESPNYDSDWELLRALCARFDLDYLLPGFKQVKAVA